MRLFQNQDLNDVLGKNLIENQEPQSSKTSLRIKILDKTSLKFSMKIFFLPKTSLK